MRGSLFALQAKVIRLKKMIDALHQKYPPEQLAEMPQFERLMTIYSNLQPLLPKCNAEPAAPRPPPPAAALREYLVLGV